MGDIPMGGASSLTTDSYFEDGSEKTNDRSINCGGLPNHRRDFNDAETTTDCACGGQTSTQAKLDLLDLLHGNAPLETLAAGLHSYLINVNLSESP